MTNEEAKKMLKAKLECLKRDTSGTDIDCNYRNCDECNLCYEQGNMGEQKEALDMAIKVLGQQPAEDCISKQAVLELVADFDLSMGQVVKGIHDLPPAQPQRKRGKWIAPNTSPSLMMMGIRLCSECNYKTQEAGKFCTNCGAEMECDTDDNMDASNNG